MSRPVSSRFSPHNVAPENLERLFVGREPLLRQLVSDVAETARAGSARFELVVGPRGAGKSHLLALVTHRLREELRSEGVVILLDEEEHVASLTDLLARVLRRMPEVEGLPSPEEQVRALQADPSGDLIDRITGMLRGRLDGAPLVLVIENLDDVFEAIGKDGQARLRAVLQEARRWSVVASTRTAGSEFTRQDSPFFGTFIHHGLGPMGSEQCRQMLLRLAQTHEREGLEAEILSDMGVGRIQAVYFLVGGIPRAMAMLFPYLEKNGLDDLVATFQDLAEDLTPYFQEQMSRLPAGKRAVMEALAENWRPLTPSAIATRLFQKPTTVSTHLRRLKQDRLVRSMQVGREAYYELADPLHRIARAMKRPDRMMETIARFLMGWHPQTELRGLLPLWREEEEGHSELLDVLEGLLGGPEELDEFGRACLHEIGIAGKEGDFDEFERVTLEMDRHGSNATTRSLLTFSARLRGQPELLLRRMQTVRLIDGLEMLAEVAIQVATLTGPWEELPWALLEAAASEESNSVGQSIPSGELSSPALSTAQQALSFLGWADPRAAWTTSSLDYVGSEAAAEYLNHLLNPWLEALAQLGRSSPALQLLDHVDPATLSFLQRIALLSAWPSDPRPDVWWPQVERLLTGLEDPQRRYLHTTALFKAQRPEEALQILRAVEFPTDVDLKMGILGLSASPDLDAISAWIETAPTSMRSELWELAVGQLATRGHIVESLNALVRADLDEARRAELSSELFGEKLPRILAPFVHEWQGKAKFKEQRVSTWIAQALRVGLVDEAIDGITKELSADELERSALVGVIIRLSEQRFTENPTTITALLMGLKRRSALNSSAILVLSAVLQLEEQAPEGFRTLLSEHVCPESQALVAAIRALPDELGLAAALAAEERTLLSLICLLTGRAFSIPAIQALEQEEDPGQ